METIVKTQPEPATDNSHASAAPAAEPRVAERRSCSVVASMWCSWGRRCTRELAGVRCRFPTRRESEHIRRRKKCKVGRKREATKKIGGRFVKSRTSSKHANHILRLGRHIRHLAAQRLRAQDIVPPQSLRPFHARVKHLVLSSSTGSCPRRRRAAGPRRSAGRSRPRRSRARAGARAGECAKGRRGRPSSRSGWRGS